MTVVLPNDIENETPADAVEVEQNFNVIEQYTNTSLINRDGTVAMAAPLQLFGDPVGDDDAVRKAYIESLLPIGLIIPYAGITVPAGRWAMCNGADVQTAVMPLLFNVCGYRFGGSGGTFKLPDLRGRVVIYMNSADTRFNTTGDKGGAWDVPVPYHRHGIDHNHTAKETSKHTHSHSCSTTGGHRHEQNTDNAVGGNVESRARGIHSQYTGNWGGTEAGDHKHVIGDSTHSHTLDLALIDAWSAYAGTSGVDHVPPYLTLSAVIRVD
jgi:microcystin-dependent protein